MPFFGFTNPLASKPIPPSPSQDIAPSNPFVDDTPLYPVQPPAPLGPPLPSTPPAQTRPDSSHSARTQPFPCPTITSTPASPIPSSSSSKTFSSQSQSQSHSQTQSSLSYPTIPHVPSNEDRPTLQPRTISHASRSSAASASSLMSGRSSRAGSVSISGSINEGQGEVANRGAAIVGWDSKGGKGKNGSEPRGRKRSDVNSAIRGPPMRPPGQTQSESASALKTVQRSNGHASSISDVPGGDLDLANVGDESGGAKTSSIAREDHEVDEEEMKLEEKRKRRAERKAGSEGKKGVERVDYDTYVIVRPPASSTKRPLNLQIQLVVPARGRSGGSGVAARKVEGQEGGRRRVAREVRSPSGTSLASALSNGTTATNTTTTSSHLGGLSGFGSPTLETGTTTPELDGDLERGAADMMDRLKLTESATAVGSGAGHGAGASSESLVRSPGLELYANVAGAAGGLFSSAWAGLGLGMPSGSAVPATSNGTVGSTLDPLPLSSSISTVCATSPVPPTTTIMSPLVPPSPGLRAIRERPDSNNSTSTQMERTEVSASVRLRKTASDSDVKGRKPLSVLDGLATPTKGILLPRGARVSSPPAHASYTHDRPSSDSGSLSPDRATGGANLSRSGSIKSELSSVGLSGLSTTGVGIPMTLVGTRPRSFSGASLASSQGASCGKKIVPLWNLSVHNVIHTTVTDAGTDARVARFTKRAIEIIDVGALEPMEIHTPRTSSLGSALNSNPLSAQSTRTNGTSLSAYGSIGSDGPFSPEAAGQGRGVGAFRASFDVKSLGARFSPAASTATPSIAGQILSGEADAADVPGFAGRSPATQPFAGTKRAFGKLFKRKDGSGSKDSADGARGSTASAQSTSSHQGEVPSPISVRSSLHAGVLPLETLPLGAPTFGCQPGLIGSSSDGRTRSYAFTIRKWVPAKAGPSLKALEMAPRLAEMSTDERPEVVIEWVKGQSSSQLRKQAFERSASPNATQSTSHDGTPRGKSQVSALRDRRVSLTSSSISPRTSVEVHRMESPLNSVAMRRRPVSTVSGGDSGATEADEGEDSDPEDSETPWYCIVRCPGTANKSKAGGRHVTVIATLFPAPHHPRVVGQIKVPLELAPIATGLVKPLSDASLSAELEEIWLSDENLKDIVGSTAMWLVVREEFGGLGKRKKV